MEKRVSNVFDFNNYRLILGTDFSLRSADNPNYSLRSYARDLKVSTGYLSEVINQKKHFSLAKGRLAFSSMGFNEDELDFIESLITLNSCSEEKKLNEARQVFDFYHTKTGFNYHSKKDRILTSVEHFLIFSLAREFTRFEDIQKVIGFFDVSEEQTKNILKDFTESGYIEEVEGEYVVRDPNFMINEHINYCDFLTNFAEFFFSHYKKQNISDKKTNSATGLILGLDANTLKEVHDLNSFYVDTLLKIANRVTEPSHFGFVSHLYLEKIFREKS